MEWLLTLAKSVQSHFYNPQIETTIKNILDKILQESEFSSSTMLITNTALNQGAPFFLLTPDPKKIFNTIVDRLRSDLSETDRLSFRPITIITKLAQREFIFDVSGNKIIYGVSSKFADANLVRSLICNQVSSLKTYFNLIEPDTNRLLPTVINTINESTEVLGGRSNHQKRHKPNPSASRISIKLKILSKMVAYVKANIAFAGSLVYINGLNDIDNHAMDLIFSDYRTRDAIVDYLKLVVKQLYPDYKFELNPHKGFEVAYDFRLRKTSCAIRNIKTDQVSYLVNMYNSGTYSPTPAYRNIDSTTKDAPTCQLVAHPLVRLRFLYLDISMLDAKTLDKTAGQFRQTLYGMINTAIEDLIAVNSRPTWVGIYRDEGYDKNQENMRANLIAPFQVILI